MKTKLSFQRLAVGQQFEFDRLGFENSGMATGPWIKTSARKYKRVSDGMECRVGSIGCAVLIDNTTTL